MASLLCQLGKKQQELGQIDAIKELQNLKLDESPILGLKLLTDSVSGLHFENDGQVYTFSTSGT